MNTIDILKLYFKNEKINPSDVTQDLINDLQKQNLLQYLYYVLDDNEQINSYYLKCRIIQHKYLYLQDELTTILNNNNINHIYLKGSVLCKLYPDDALRTRGDIDILILDKFEEAKKVLSEFGYNEGVPSYHHTEFKKAGLEIELHNHLLPLCYKNYTYFDNIFKIKQIDKNYYELDHNIHYLFNIWHFNRHAISGEGLRYLLDFYYMQKNWDLDFNFINTELEKTNLTKFHNSIINSIYELTGEKLTGFTKENDLVLINYLNDSGIHGRKTNPEANILIGTDSSKFKYILDRLFLFDKRERKEIYPYLSKSFLLYPFLLIHRLSYLVFKRLCSLKRVIKLKTNNSHKEILQEIGVVNL